MKVYILIAVTICVLSACNFWGDVEQTVSVASLFPGPDTEKWEWVLVQADRIESFTTHDPESRIVLKRAEPFFVLVRPEGKGYEYAGAGRNMPDSSILYCTARGGEVYAEIQNVILQKGSVGAINHTRLMEECSKLESKRNRALRKSEILAAFAKQQVSSRSFKLAPLLSLTVTLPPGEYIPLSPIDDHIVVPSPEAGSSVESMHTDINLSLGEGLHRYLLKGNEVWIEVLEESTTVVFR